MKLGDRSPIRATTAQGDVRTIDSLRESQTASSILGRTVDNVFLVRVLLNMQPDGLRHGISVRKSMC